MYDFGPITFGGEDAGRSFRECNRPVPAARAANGDRQIIFSLMNVMREEIKEEIFQSVHEFLGLRITVHKLLYRVIPAGFVLQSGNIIRVGKKANVKHQYRVGRDAESKAEGNHGNEDGTARLRLTKAELDKIAKFMNVHSGGVDDHVREFAHRLQQHAFKPDPFPDGQITAHGMRPSRLPKPPDQSMVRGLEKNERDFRVRAVQALVHGRELAEGFAFADVRHHGGALNRTVGLLAELGKLGDETDGKVIDAVVAQILECFQHRALARTAEAGDHNKLAVCFFYSCSFHG